MRFFRLMMSTAPQNNYHNNPIRNFMDKVNRNRTATMNRKMLYGIDRLKRVKHNPLSLRKGDEKKIKNVSTISFSPRAIALGALQASRNSHKILERQLEINKITDYHKPMVHKLSPLQVSQNIKMRSKLAKLMPKKNLQPKLHCSISPLIQRQLQPIEPCNNYRQKHERLQVDVNQDSRITIKKTLNLKQKGLLAPRFTQFRGIEHIPATRPDSIAFAKDYCKQQKKEGKVTNLLNPLKNIFRYAKGLTKAMKSDK